MHKFDIFNATFPWRGCKDMRPWLIVEVRAHDIFAALPISGQCYDGDCFPLVMTDRDFAATGLKKSCFILDTHVFDIPRGLFGQRRGVLTGELLVNFRRYSGF